MDLFIALLAGHAPRDNDALVEIVFEKKPDHGPAGGEWEHFPATDKHLEHSKRELKDAYSGARVREILAYSRADKARKIRVFAVPSHGS